MPLVNCYFLFLLLSIFEPNSLEPLRQTDFNDEIIELAGPGKKNNLGVERESVNLRSKGDITLVSHLMWNIENTLGKFFYFSSMRLHKQNVSIFVIFMKP